MLGSPSPAFLKMWSLLNLTNIHIMFFAYILSASHIRSLILRAALPDTMVIRYLNE